MGDLSKEVMLIRDECHQIMKALEPWISGNPDRNHLDLAHFSACAFRSWGAAIKLKDAIEALGAEAASLVPRSRVAAIERELADAESKLGAVQDSARAEIVRLEAERDRLREQLSAPALKHGGKNAGHAYGPTNCAACGALSNDYYLIGKSQLCMDCYEKFPAAIQEARQQASEARQLADTYARALADIAAGSYIPEAGSAEDAKYRRDLAREALRKAPHDG